MMGRPNRKGFTWTEAVVVVSIVFVLFALLSPALHSHRRPARRTACKNNLKQIMLAMHNYHDVYSSFPAGWYESDSGDGTANWAWSAMLLPFLQEPRIYDALDIKNSRATGAVRNPDKGAMFERGYEPFRCPEDDAPDVIDITFGNRTLAVPRSNYVAANGSGRLHVDAEVAEPFTGPVPRDPAEPVGANGLFVRNVGRTVREIYDGTSNTIAVGERGTTVPPDPKTGRPEIAAAAAVLFVVSGSDDPRTLNGNAAAGRGQNVALFAGLFGINSARGVTDSPSPEASFGVASRHVGGVQVGLADGTVRFISERIDFDPSPEIDSTWEQLLARNDGQVPGEF
ncbi:MAG: DUF1559 domain-containing protein [Planctomycetota bacterium]